MVEQVFSGAFEEAMHCCTVMESGYCVLVHARLRSVQRILPYRRCAYMQYEAQLRVEKCIGFGSSSVVHCVGIGVKLNGGIIV